MKRFRIALVGSTLALLGQATEASITVTSNCTFASANDTVGGNSSAGFSGTTIPTSTTLVAIDGISHSKNSFEWSATGGQTTLSFDMDQRRDATESSYAQTFEGSLHFAAISSASYLSGYYDATDVGTLDSSFVSQFVEVYDVTASTLLFRYEQVSHGTHDEQVTLGSTGTATT